MITGIGVDLVEVARIAEKLARNPAFRAQVFSADEIAYCEKNVHPAEHYAARFAAKEAFLKATGLGLQAGHTLTEIEVYTNEAGKPFLKLSGAFASLALQQGWHTVHVSLTHVHPLACAFVILEK